MPASDPVCAMAAERPASDWPSLMATIASSRPRGRCGSRRPAWRLRDRLDIDDDDLEFRLVGEKRDVIRYGQTGFVAAGDQIFGRDPAFLQRRIDEYHHAAALADQRHRPDVQRQRPLLGQRDEAALGADIAHAIGAGNAEPGLGDDGGSSRPIAAPSGPTPRQSRRKTPSRCAHRPPRPLRSSLGYTRRRHDHDQMIGRLGKRLEIRIARGPRESRCAAD